MPGKLLALTCHTFDSMSPYVWKYAVPPNLRLDMLPWLPFRLQSRIVAACLIWPRCILCVLPQGIFP